MKDKYQKTGIAVLLLTAAVLLAACSTDKSRVDEIRNRHKAEETGETDSLQEMQESFSAEEKIAEAEPVAEQSIIEEPVEEPVVEEVVYREPLPKFHDILEINPYVAGWLRIDGSLIDDPVVYTPVSQNYFLHRDIAGNDTSAGTLFIAVNWQENYHNTLIYGHNMKDGSGFGSLSKFTDPSYGLSHNILHFDTLYEERDYELFAVFYSQIDEEELETEEDRQQADEAIEAEGIARKEEELAAQAAENPQQQPPEEFEPIVLTLADLDLFIDFGDMDIYRQEKDEDNGRFRYYYYTDLSDKADFDYYVKNVKERALYDTGVEAEWGDDLIT
ncbi:MAG: class B sortase, partial [Lachnospiraceae bacterium]|nr:class B sortase [Lachnospiraceae bacterium]